MDLKENSDIIKLIKVLHKKIKKHGIKDLLKSLQKVDFFNTNKQHLDVIDFIETSLCKRFKILRATLYQKNSKVDISTARKLCVLFLSKHLDMSDEEIKNHYSRTRQTIHNIKSDFKRLDAKIKVDAEFINVYNEFDTKIQDYISEIKSIMEDEETELKIEPKIE